jgi:SAM-dependent methyltransferase
MPRYVRLQELLVGVAGLALLRNLYDGTDEAAAERLDDVRRVLADDSLRAGELTSEADARTGYGAWSDSYDEPGNPIVALEEPAVRSLVESLPPGPALDAACGTGRHALRLAELGHDVTGFDVTPEMLRVAAERVPEGRFVAGDLREIPSRDGAFDLVVCGLALAHLDDLRAGVDELARVARPGGRIVVSVLHPFQALLGWQAPFADASGRRGFVREHPHTHADYLAAFTSAGLRVRGCVEPELTAEHVPAKRRAFRHLPEATVQAYAGLPAVLVWDIEKTG